MKTFNAQRLAAVALAQSTEESSYYLCGVFLEKDKAIATDCHILTIATQEGTDNGEGQIFPISKKAITAMKSQKAENVVFENDLLTITDETGAVIHIEPCKEIDGTFPDWQQVVPTETGDVCHGAFNHPILTRVAQTAKLLSNARDNPISLKGEDASNGHIVTYHNSNDVFSVIMPIWRYSPPDK